MWSMLRTSESSFLFLVCATFINATLDLHMHHIISKRNNSFSSTSVFMELNSEMVISVMG